MFPLLFVVWTLAATLPGHAAEDETLSRADKALFDELQVNADKEKDARERLEKSAPPLQASGLPGPAAKILGQLELYEASLDEITGEMIVRTRKSAGAQLIKLSGATPEPGKSQLIATAKTIEVLTPGTDLLATAAEESFTGEWIYESKVLRESRWFNKDGTIRTPWSKGTWRWLNQSYRVVVVEYNAHDYADLVVVVTSPGKPPRLEAFSPVDGNYSMTRKPNHSAGAALPAEASRIVATAREQESTTRLKTLGQKKTKRERVAAWLVEKAKAADAAAAQLLLERAAALRSGKLKVEAEMPGSGTVPFGGKAVTDEKKRAWEFLSDGTVRCKGAAWGQWEWARAKDESTILVYSGGPGKADNPLIVRASTTSPGVVRFKGQEEKFEGKMKP